MKTLIVYGSCGGNTKLVCDEVAAILGDCEVLPAKVASVERLEKRDFDLLILASPTYGHGLLEDYMAAFVAKAGKVDLSGVKAVAIGLGDKKYDSDYHMEAADILTRFLRERGAEVVRHPLEINRSPLPYLENLVRDFALFLKDLNGKD